MAPIHSLSSHPSMRETDDPSTLTPKDDYDDPIQTSFPENL
jgi:hypothetical protein